jgi:UDP-N-acetylglucosamine enolpyruvyl transferase
MRATLLLLLVASSQAVMIKHLKPSSAENTIRKLQAAGDEVSATELEDSLRI